MIQITVLFILVWKTAVGADNVLSDSNYLTLPGPSLVTVPGFVDVRELECIDMIKVNSDLNFEQEEEARVLCGAYFIGDADELLSLEVHGVDINCDQGEFVEIFDGWMARDRFLPSEEDHEHSLNTRLKDYCSHQRAHQNAPWQFTSMQNFALVQFRLLAGSRLSIRFRRLKSTNEQCNILTPDDEGEYKMTSNVEKNCTFSILQASVLIIKEIKLSQDNLQSNKGTVEVLKGDSLDPSAMTLVQKFEAPIHENAERKLILDKVHAAVRMTSPGHSGNFIRFAYSRLADEEALKAELCT